MGISTADDTNARGAVAVTGDGTDDGTDDLAEFIQAIVDQHGFMNWLDLQIAEVSEGRAVLELPYREELGNPATGSIHGGLLATLVDTASGMAIQTTFEEFGATGLTTTDMSVSYVRPARSDVRAEAEVVRVGGSMAVTEVEVSGVAPGGERKTVVVGSTSFRLFRSD
ncbi:MAG: PaaI family thioesterase [Haloarculaceae archaeon]